MTLPPPSRPTPSELHLAMRTLAGVCDGTDHRNDANFAQSDVWHGLYLAHLDPAGWSDYAVTVAAFLARKYQGRLTALGIHLDLSALSSGGEGLPCANPAPACRLPVRDGRPRDAWDDIKERARLARAKTRENKQQPARQAETPLLDGQTNTPLFMANKAKLARGCLTFDGTSLLLHGEKNWKRTVAARMVPGRRFLYEPEPHDVFPLTSLNEVLDLCRAFGVAIDIDVTALTARAQATVQAEQDRVRVQRAGPKTLRVDFPYDAAFVTRFKDIAQRYRPRFNRDDETDLHWLLTYDHDLKTALETLASLGLKAHPELTEEASRQVTWAPVDVQAARALAKATGAPAVPLPGVVTPLMPHQYVPLHALARHRRALVADAPGLGKSLEAIAALTHLERQRALVVCPSNLTGNWEAEFDQHAPGQFSTFVCEGRVPGEIPADVRVVICGWAVLAQWQVTMNSWTPDAVIIDEAHYGKSAADLSGSARGRAAVELCETARAGGGVILAMTGTPIINRPKELLPLLDMLGATDSLGGSWKYRMRYCGAVQKHIPGLGLRWTFEGASHTEELHHRLVDSGLYIRRTKQMLVEAGVMTRKTINGADAYDHAAVRTPLRVTLTPEQRRQYDQAVKKFRQWVAQMAEEEAARMGEPLTPERLADIIERKTASLLPQIGLVRALLGQLKIPHVQAHVDNLIEQGEQVVVVAHHRAVVDQYARHYGGLKIQGGMGVKGVEKIKRTFNTATTSSHPVLALSIEAGKTGHSLCLQRLTGAGKECARMVFAEEGYVPGDEEQAQDRIWRIGQTREVIITNILAEDTLDEGLFSLKDSKRGATTSVIDGFGDVNTASAVSYLTSWLMYD